jgi:gliding motility-associated-like protein
MSIFSLMAQHSSLHLVENRGQWPADVVAATDVQGGKVFLEKSTITYHLFDLTGMRTDHDIDSTQPRIRGHVYKVHFEGSKQDGQHAAFSDQLQSYSNYYLGNQPAHWAGGCAHYREAVLSSIYPGIDLHMHAGGPFLKYDLIVQPGAHANLVRMRYEGHTKLSLERDRLVVTTSIGEVTEQKPIAWQIMDGQKRMIACSFRIHGNEVTFDFPKGYDKRYPLVIDPELVFSTYSGSTSNNFGYTATYDQAGSLYSGSSAFGQNYPTVLGSYDVLHNGGASTIEQGIDIALSKYNLNGSFMLWSTFLGGSGDELPHSIIVNEQEELIVYGSTGSADFPITTGAIDMSFGGGPAVAPTGTGANFPNGTDIIVSRLSAFGDALLGSTYIGGNANDGICDATALKYNYADEFRGEVELDALGNILIVSSTHSNDIATTNAMQVFPGGGLDALIAKLSSDLTQVQWMTYYGSAGDDSGFSIAESSTGNHYICGGTTSPTLNLGNAGAQATYGGGSADAYIIRLSPNGSQLTAGSYWGATAYDQAYFIEIDNDDFIYIFGQTAAGNSLVQNASYVNANSGNMITKFESSLSSVVWSTLLGTGDGKPNLSPSAFLVDYCNRVYISGWGVNATSGNPLNPGDHLQAMFTMPTTNNAYDATSSTGDFYMAVFDENMTNLEYATFFGGSTSNEHVDGGTSRFDKKGVIYQSVCAGCGGNDDFPISDPTVVLGPTNGTTNGCNNGVFKFDFQLPQTVADFYNDPTECIGNPSNFINNSVGAETFLWDFGDGTVSTEENPSHLYATSGTYTITLTVSSANTCNGTDIAEGTITITDPQEVTLENVVVCASPNNVLSVPSAEGIFSWSPSSNLSDPTGYATFYYGTESQDFIITQLNSGCITNYTLHADVLQFETVTSDTVLCEPAEITLSAQYSPSNAAIIWSDTNNWGFNAQLNDDSTDVDITVQAIHSIVYYVQIVSGSCSVEQPVFVQLADDQTTLQPDFNLCATEPVMLSVENPNPQFSYSWTPAALIVAGQNTSTIMANISEATLFTVISVSDEGCIASDSVLVSVSTLNPQNVDASANPSIIAPGENAQLNATPLGYSYSWSPSSTLTNSETANPLASPEVTTIYTVTIVDSQCSVTDTVEVRVINLVCGPPSIFVPNTFTPNADGKNEKLYVRGVNLSKVHFSIYNRWGQLVFETYSKNEGWDGTFKDMKVDPDVFVYYLDATCDGGEEYFEKGNITLIR